jgi:hypothetical protein
VSHKQCLQIQQGAKCGRELLKPAVQQQVPQ